MKVVEFIKSVFVKEIMTLQQTHGYHYLSFALIPQGIEFLGACIDDNDLSQHGKSRERFNKAIVDLFPDEYDHIYNWEW